LGLGAVLFVVVLVGYFPAIHGGFIWDDKVLLSESALVHASDGLYRFWFTTQAPDYWPLTSTTFWVEWRLWGMDPLGYHLTNLVLHGVEALLVWAILERLGIGGAYLAGLLFAAHPVNVESVAWIAQRKNLVAMLFFLLAILFWLRSESEEGADRGGRGRGWYWASVGMFVLAMLGKGSVAPLPAVLLLLAWWQRGRLGVRDLVRVVPYGVVSVLLVAVNVWFQTHGTGPIRQAGVVERVLGAGGVVWFYLWKALWPLRLSFVYPQWKVDPGRALWWLPALAALAVTVLLWRSRDGWGRGCFAAWCFFCVSLVPVMGLTDVYFMTFSLVADHYEHVALIGVMALLGAGWAWGWKRLGGRWRRAWAGVAGLVVAGLVLLTARQSAAYRDEETIYRATIAANPDCWMAYYNLGVDLSDRGDRKDAITQFEQALRVRPDYAEAHNNLALALSAEGRDAEAMAHAREAVRIKPGMPEARVDLGILLSRSGHAAEALTQLEKAVELRADSAEAHYNLGLVLAALGRLPEAMAHYREALRLEPGSAEAHNALGTGLLAEGRSAEACSEFERALSIRPEYAEALGNLGLALARSGRAGEAISRYEEALRLRADYPEAHYNLGTLLDSAGRTQEALVHYEQAVRLRPDYAEAQNNLAVLLAGTGRAGEALEHFEQAARARPEFLAARLNLAETSARLGRFAEAAAQGEAALALAPAAQKPALETKLRTWRALARSR
jgi:tetratricopeptide (TPR) repeat protein